jgi:hypothetical protein
VKGVLERLDEKDKQRKKNNKYTWVTTCQLFFYIMEEQLTKNLKSFFEII